MKIGLREYINCLYMMVFWETFKLTIFSHFQYFSQLGAPLLGANHKFSANMVIIFRISVYKSMKIGLRKYINCFYMMEFREISKYTIFRHFQYFSQLGAPL